MKVLMRRTNRLTNQVDLIPVDVLSQSNGKMRVKAPGMYYPLEINASDTMPCTQTRREYGMTAPQRSYNVPGSLARDLYR